jgi:hypothetical protein
MLSRAGVELSRISAGPIAAHSRTALLSRIAQSVQNAHLYIAEVPSKSWNGTTEDLEWKLFDVRYTNMSDEDRRLKSELAKDGAPD